MLKNNYSICLKNILRRKKYIPKSKHSMSEEHPEEQIQYLRTYLFRSKHNMSEEHTEEQKQFVWRTLSTYSRLVQCCTWRFHLMKIYIYLSTQVQRLKLLHLMLPKPERYLNIYATYFMQQNTFNVSADMLWHKLHRMFTSKWRSPWRYKI